MMNEKKNKMFVWDSNVFMKTKFLVDDSKKKEIESATSVGSVNSYSFQTEDKQFCRVIPMPNNFSVISEVAMTVPRKHLGNVFLNLNAPTNSVMKS